MDPRSAEQIFENLERAVARFAVGYNKSVVMNTVTKHSLDIVDTGIGTIEDSLSTIVAAFEEIRATSQSTADNSKRIDLVMKEILAENDATGSGITEQVGKIAEAAENATTILNTYETLKNNSKEIESVTDSIRNVAEVTNILAINAAVEAARAGSAGAGFHVIAQEVRKLAAQTGQFTQQIESTVGQFSSLVDFLSEQMSLFLSLIESLNDSFKHIKAGFAENAESLRSASGMLSQIAGSVREETTALADGLDSLESITVSLKDTHSVFLALRANHEYLDTLLDRQD
ncbi:methyl-accepting chemotaxis protein [Salinispira pacifica]